MIEGGGNEGRVNYKGTHGNGGDKYVHYLDCGDSFVQVYMCQHL